MRGSQLLRLLICAIAYLCCLIDVIVGTVAGNMFMALSNVNTVGTIKTVPSVSPVECASFCVQDSGCASCHFDEQSGTCQLSDTGINAATGDVYWKENDCPTGYTQITFPGGAACLKIITHENVTNNVAKNRCIDLCGGHLSLIENSHMFSAVQTYLMGETQVDLWIDGEDVDGDKNYTTWHNLQLSYTNWDSYNPDLAGHTCIKMKFSSRFQYADTRCDQYLNYLCQVDYMNIV